MMASVTAALLIHAAVFVAVQLGVRFRPETPEYGGPLTVTLADSLEPPQAARPGEEEPPEQAALPSGEREEGETAEQEAGGPGETALAQQPAPGREPSAGRAPSPGRAETTGGGSGDDTGSAAAGEPVPYTETRPREIDEPTTYNAPVRRRRDTGKILEGRDFSPSWEEELDREGAGGAAGGGSASAGAEGSGAPESGPERAAGGGEQQAGGLDLGRIDQALEQAEGDTGRPEPSVEGEPAEEPDRPGDTIAGDTSSREGPDITWEDASRGRRLLSPAEDPRIPEWVQREGLYLTVTVSFTVTPLGNTTGLRVDKSSGYPDVDAAVTEVVRGLRFNPVRGADPVSGTIRYIINTR
jgi:TonB family protein